ncbi:hypothetical protein [Candidatus Amarolinea dominans]|uniref:hypothetical protein n=1 Tax=Candidatus Amarolinea dominans TaxID=3140696 RepID=UPI0031CC4C6B
MMALPDALRPRRFRGEERQHLLEATKSDLLRKDEHQQHANLGMAQRLEHGREAEHGFGLIGVALVRAMRFFQQKQVSRIEMAEKMAAMKAGTW